VAEPQPPADVDTRAYRTISIRVLVGTILVVAIGGASLYFWHAYQKKRGAEVLLAQAEQLVADAGQPDQAAGYADAASLLFRYTQIQPGDIEAQIRLAEVYEKSVSDERGLQRATTLLYDALGLADTEKQDSLRRTLVNLLLRQGAFLEAATQAQQLVSQGGADDYEVARLHALALFGRYRTGDIPANEFRATASTMVDVLRRAVALKPDPELVEPLSVVLHDDNPRLVIDPIQTSSAGESANEEGGQEAGTSSPAPPMSREARVAEAVALMDRMVAERSTDAIAYLVRFNYRRQHKLPGADEDLAQALQLGGDDLRVRLIAANNAYFQARQTLEDNALASLPPSSDTPSGLSAEQQAAIDAARRGFQEAAGHFQHVLDKIEPQNMTALLGVGRTAISLGEPDKAAALWSKALATPRPDQLPIRYYLAQLYVNERNWAAAKPVLAELQNDVDKFNLRPDRARFESLRNSVELLNARVLMGEQNYARALPLLERAAAGEPVSEFETAEHGQAHLLAGECHNQAGRPDLAANAFENAAKFANGAEAKASAYAAAAQAWAATGATENALADAQRAVKQLASPESLILLARLLLNQQQSLPPAEQDWQQFNELLNQLAEADSAGRLTASWRRELLEADAKVIQAADAEQVKAALENTYQALRRAEEQFPDDQQLLRQLIQAYHRLQKPDDADRALQKFQQVTQDAFVRTLVEADLRYERREYAQALACLDSLNAELSPADRVMVAKSKARILAADGKTAEAAALLKALAKDHPDDLTIARMRLQVVEQLQDGEARRELETELLGGSQEDKSWALALKIQRLVAAARSARDPGWLEALDLLARLETARPGWSVVYSLRGEAEERRATFVQDEEQQRSIMEQAARAYQRAVALGDRTISVQERLVNALYRAGRFQEATEHLTRNDRAVPLSSALSEIAINIALEGKQQEHAIEVARRALETRPDDVMARVWYGMVQMAGGQLQAAEQTMLEAVQNAPQDDRSWNGLFTFYVRGGNTDKARETLQQMMAQANMSAERRAFVLAQGYEALGDDAQAESAYQDAFKKFPDNARIRSRLIEFYLARANRRTGSGQQGVATLQEIVRRNPADSQAKRALVTLMAAEGGDQWREALRMLGQSGSDDAASRRLEGVLLFQRDGVENLAAARKVFESLISSPDADPNDRLILARILERQGEMDAARQQCNHIAEQQPPHERGLMFVVDFLIRQNDLAEAQRWQTVLEDATKSAFNLEVIKLQARLLAAQGQSADVVQRVDPPVLEQFQTLADNQKAAKIAMANDVGGLYSQLGLHAAAEAWYRRLLELDATRYASLAICLARQNRLTEALDLCESELARSSADAVVSALADALAVTKPSAADYARAEPILAAAEQSAAQDANVLLKISNVRFLQGKLDDVVRLLEKAVQLDPRNVLALNNLAMILAERPGDRVKAHQYIDQALDVTGPRADLCDTKAAIHLYDNQPAEALPLLEFASRALDSGAIVRFHLAAAYFGTQRLEEAAACYRQAMDAGLENQFLTDSDRKLMAAMQDLLKTTADK